jgi:hypothetical protein
MQVRCIKAFGTFKPGDVVDDVPDGAAFDPEHFEAVAPPPPPPPGPPKPAVPVAPVTLAAALSPKEGA